MKTKAKLKDSRLLGAAVFFCALAALLLWPAGVKAETAGDFTATGDTSGYSYNGGVLTVNSGADLTIRNTGDDKAAKTATLEENTSIGVNVEVDSASLAQAKAGVYKGTLNFTLSVQ